jgi:outer membrane murein-binding lipoprotein Lpp
LDYSYKAEAVINIMLMKALKFLLPILIIVSLLAISQVTAAHVLAPDNSIHKDAGAVVEEQKTDLLSLSAEVSRLNSELNQRDIEVKQLSAELTAAQEQAAYWEGKAHPRQFTSVEELKAWLASNDINEREYIPDTYDCDNFAQDLMKAALADGYLVSTELWSCHMLNSTIIGNNIYTIEPMTDGVQFVGELDPPPASDNHK